jgi:hypothetical protein
MWIFGILQNGNPIAGVPAHSLSVPSSGNPSLHYRNLVLFTQVQMLDNRTRPQWVHSPVEHMSVTIKDSPPSLVVRSNRIFEIAR